ncbi:MAG TPA: hypothetical protein VKO18_16285 [Terriglobia bacterium]|nr:hypothetical protein [Terriglobia bacterium]
MRFPKTLTFLILATGLIVAPFAGAQQKNVGPSSAGPRPNAVRPYVACAAAMPALPARAQQKPFTQEQVSNMVRDGFGDESGAKLIERRGIDFAPGGVIVNGKEIAPVSVRTPRAGALCA